jgi:hypothetical protein
MLGMKVSLGDGGAAAAPRINQDFHLTVYVNGHCVVFPTVLEQLSITTPG